MWPVTLTARARPSYPAQHGELAGHAALPAGSTRWKRREDAFEADGIKYKAGTFIIRMATAQLEKAAKDLGLKVHATDSNWV